MREYIRFCSEMAERPPDFSGMGEAERAAEAERLREEAMEEARRLTEAGDLEGGRWREGEARILDFDPKQSGIYMNRCTAVDVRTFDYDEESPIGPMMLTDKVYQPNQRVDICGGLNILTVKIACSDVGYPIKVYGTVRARDSIDDRCVYLFRRDRDHCQYIKSKDKSLILTGPKRGLAVLDDNFVEIDLKIKGRRGQDRELSKGFIRIRGLPGRSLETCVVETKSLATRLSTVDVEYAVVKRAVEATIAVEVLEGDFVGTIIAHTTCVKTNLLLYHSEVAGDGHGVIQVKRPAVSVFMKELLIIAAKTEDGKSIGRIAFTPKIKGRAEDVLNVGATKMRVKVAWSIMDPLIALNPLVVKHHL
ncbi:hypothetical protein HU200_053297 [Digitaria exilis]|uniref:DUF6598 domain-containing protein n=1 Tax=Digitaria exilis TaxID=1010633 RepID=A0A835E811_9POAL|nr:hypothetical protein HU200_053297 [Digitaria exilis]